MLLWILFQNFLPYYHGASEFMHMDVALLHELKIIPPYMKKWCKNGFKEKNSIL